MEQTRLLQSSLQGSIHGVSRNEATALLLNSGGIRLQYGLKNDNPYRVLSELNLHGRRW